MTYRVLGADPLELDGYRIAQTDRFHLCLRSSTFAEMRLLINNLVTTIRSSNYSMDMVDYEQSYDPTFGTDGAYVTDIELDFTYLIDAAGGPSGTFASELPLAVVYPIGRAADSDSIADNLIMQQTMNQYAVVIATNGGNLPALLDEVQGVLLGFQQAASYHDMEYVSGANIGGAGTMELWREVYQDWHIMREA